MPRVVVSGYYGFHNVGDEAMLYAMLEALSAAVPDLEVVVLSGDPAYTAARFGVEAVLRTDLRQVAAVLRRADLLISGGGGLLQDVTGPKSIVYYLGIVSLALLLGRPVFFYAQGIGPVNTRLGRLLVRLVAGRVNSITVRDTDSKEELCRLGVAGPAVTVTADPVLGLDVSKVDRRRGQQLLEALGVVPGRPVAGVSVRPWKGLDGYKQAVARACDDLAAAGWQVLLVPMHSPGDDAACREVAAHMRNRAVVVGGPLDFMDALAMVANLGLAVGMRLHFLIFGALFSVPLVGIPYDPKVNRFLQAVGLPPGLPVETLKYEELAARIKETIDNHQLVSGILREKTAELKIAGLKNASMVAELLNKRQN